jgi:hypothetical protein
VSNDAIYPLLAEPDLDAHKGFILAEEDALKAHVSGITVPPVPSGRGDPVPVKVWYRFPEGERQIAYPFITIDLLSAEPAFDLFHSIYFDPAEGMYQPDFSPTLPDPPLGWNRATWQVQNFLPFRLMFQVSHFSRSNLHDRYLTSIFMTDVFPVRPFFILNPADQTWRRTEMLGMASANMPETTESGTKRIFRKYYTISMLAEIPQDRFGDPNDQVYRVLRTLIPVTTLEQFDSYRKRFLDNQPDPINTFSEEERAAGGEYFHVIHEGHDLPSAT